MRDGKTESSHIADIAVVGMAVRLPGAGDLGAFWSNLREGLSSVRRLTAEELLAAGVSEGKFTRPDYVPYAAPLDGFADFDAEFFGLSPKEAAVMDPQHRQFLETAWEAMEHAGHPPESVGGNVGVFAGCGMGSYFYFNVCSNRDLVADTGMFLLRHTGNDKDFMSTRVSHAFDLKGPSIGLQTACSTSLVAIHYAAQALQSGDCDMALAGGVTIELPQGQGYVYKENEILSPDGTCRAFDHKAGGTVFGSGAGVVVLRRLEDAIADGDHIWAVLKGSAINNDGAVKASYLAPSVEGQAAAIVKAHKAAGIDAGTVGYVECHGTGTYLGDPIEVAALTDAFRETTDGVDFCRIGSVKTNIGHLDTAAGVASFVKAALALHNEEIPPSLNFEAPNPAIAFEGSPFRVNAALTPWPRGDAPRRAGVNSLGVGGTNAHVVLEEPPLAEPSGESDWPFHPLVLSARSKKALDEATDRLAAHLEGPGADQPLADIAFTLKEGRHGFDRRRVVVAETAAEAAALLRERHPRRVFSHTVVGDDPDVVFMFPGGGAQYAGMARELYDTEPVFRDWMDKGLAILEPQLDFDIRAIWLPEPGDEEAANARLQAPSVQLPLIMIVEYALAQLWMSWGVKPAALIGHSMGENTAACLSGVMTLEECISLVLLRGRLFETVEAGGMLSVPLSEKDLQARLPEDLDIASINAPGLCVVSGTRAGLDRFAAELLGDGIESRRIQIDIAAHSRLLEPILDRFGAFLKTLDLKAPQIPFVSNRTGDWITDDEATDPDYWVGHLRNTIRFRDGLTTLSEKADRLYIEVGPGVALASLAGQHDVITQNQVIGTLRHPEDRVADDVHFMGMLARVWAAGGSFDWSQVWAGARRCRVPLPTYPFQHSRYFIEPVAAGQVVEHQELTRLQDRDRWTWKPVWKPAYADIDPEEVETSGAGAPKTWLILEDDTGLGAEISKRLRTAGHTVISAHPGDVFARDGETGYRLAVERGQDSFDSLIRDLKARDIVPERLVHLWLVTGDETARPGSSFFHRVQEQGFWTLFHFARAWEEQGGGDLHINVITSEAARVGAEPLKYPQKAMIAGPARVIPREFPGITCATMDIAAPGVRQHPALRHVMEELLSAPSNAVAAVRGDKRYVQTWREATIPSASEFEMSPGQVVLITGGLGGIGLAIADSLIRERGAKVAIVSRRALPERSEWERIIRLAPPDDRRAGQLSRLIELESLGEVRVIAADVSNVEEMEVAVADIRATLGPIRGVIHAAGLMRDAPILGKDLLEISDVLTPKVHGTNVLMRLFKDDMPEWIALFSSVSTVTAPAGQVDYVAANEYLNAVAHAYDGGSTRVRVIDWGPWSKVGMAVDALEGTADSALAIGDEVHQPLLQSVFEGDGGSASFHARWSTASQWILDEHRTSQGDALLPGTGYLELFAEALAAKGETGAFEISGLTFLSPLRAPDDVQVAVRVEMESAVGGYEVRVESARGDAGYELHAEASLRLLEQTEAPRIDVARISARCPNTDAVPERSGLPTPQLQHLQLGPRWQVMRSRSLGVNEGLAVLRLTTRDEGFRLHPGVMDIATGFGLPLVEGYRPDQFWVPLSYGRVRVHGPLPSEVVSWIRSAPDNNAQRQTARFDITVAAPDGRVLVEIEGFVLHRMSSGQVFASAASVGARALGRNLSPGEARLRRFVEQGIPPEEGAEMFYRAMASDQRQLVVSSMDLMEMAAEVERVSLERTGTGAAFERPDLESEFVAPETDIERRLAEFWSELLGVSKVGVEDDFFDLGGHSLIAVRLFAKIKSEFSVDLPISVLFEAPTIRKCADLVLARTTTAQTKSVRKAGEAASVDGHFRHVVVMHDRAGAVKTPFFMVAGMFGNVLNLRHLAHLIGAERPFYGLQARGLYGEDDPHQCLHDAARDYIAEMRKVQPEGPYMIGGFSGGGITAYEMARQLKEAGEDVSALVMLDTPLPRRRPLSRPDRLKLQFLKLREAGAAYPFDWARRRIRWEFAKRRAVEFETDQTEFHNAAIKAGFLNAIGRYEVKPWQGPMTLLRPPLSRRYEIAPGRFVNDDREYVHHANDWDRYVPNLEVVEVPGDHDSMVLEPNVRVLAARMRAILDRAETDFDRADYEDLHAAE